MPEYIDLTKTEKQNITDWKVSIVFDGEELSITTGWPDDVADDECCNRMVSLLHILNTGQMKSGLIESVKTAGQASMKDLMISQKIIKLWEMIETSNEARQFEPIVRPRDVFPGKNRETSDAAI